MRIAILGAPGSGKGTQAKLLAARHRVARISTGDLLREAAAEGKLERPVARAVAGRRAVADEVVIALLEERLRLRDSKRGFIIDDFPRNIPQAQALDALLGMLGRALQIAIFAAVDDPTLMERIKGRIACTQCGAVYHRQYIPPQTRSKCDACAGKLVPASGGTAKTMANRIAAYHTQAAPLVDYYKAQHKLRTVPADGDAEATQQKICEIVDLEIRPLEIKTLETAAETLDEEINTVIAGGQINRVASTPNDLAKKKRAAKAKEIEAHKAEADKVEADKVAARKGVAKKVAVKKSAVKKTGGGSRVEPKAGGRSAVKTAIKKTVTRSTVKTATEKTEEGKALAGNATAVASSGATVDKKTAVNQPAVNTTESGQKPEESKTATGNATTVAGSGATVDKKIAVNQPAVNATESGRPSHPKPGREKEGEPPEIALGNG